MAPNNESTFSQVEQALGNSAKGVEVILLVDINVRLHKTCDAREEELEEVVAACGLEEITAHLIPRRRYRGDGQ